MDNDDDDLSMLDEPQVRSSVPSLHGEVASPRTLPNFRHSLIPSVFSRQPNGFRDPHISSFPPSDDELAAVPSSRIRESREASVLARDASNLTIDQPPKPPQDQIDFYLSDLDLKERDPVSSYLSELPTGYCYDVRMRYHAELEPPTDRRDYHPEDPKRIYEIYRELCVAGLILDETIADLLGDVPTVSRPLVRIEVRDVDESEVELVHDLRHWALMSQTPSNIPIPNNGIDHDN